MLIQVTSLTLKSKKMRVWKGSITRGVENTFQKILTIQNQEKEAIFLQSKIMEVKFFLNSIAKFSKDYNPKRFPLLSTSDKSPKHCDQYETGNIASKIRYESKTELKRDLNDLLSTVKTESRESKNMNLTGSPYLKRKKFRKGNLKNLVNNTSTSVDCEENDISKFTIDELYPITNVMTSRERTYYREEIQKLASKLREKALTNDRLNSANNDFIQKMRFEKSKIKELEERSVKVIEELSKLKIENEG